MKNLTSKIELGILILVALNSACSISAFGVNSCPPEFSAVSSRASRHHSDFCGNEAFLKSDQKLESGLKACAALTKDPDQSAQILNIEKGILNEMAALCRTYNRSNKALVETCGLKGAAPAGVARGPKEELVLKGNLTTALQTQQLFQLGIQRARKVGAVPHAEGDKVEPLKTKIDAPPTVPVKAAAEVPKDAVDPSKVLDQIKKLREKLLQTHRLAAAVVANRSITSRQIPPIPDHDLQVARCWGTRDAAKDYLTSAEKNLLGPLEVWDKNLKLAEDRFKAVADKTQSSITKLEDAIKKRCTASPGSAGCEGATGAVPVGVVTRPLVAPDRPVPTDKPRDVAVLTPSLGREEVPYVSSGSRLEFKERPVGAAVGIATEPPSGFIPPQLPAGAEYRGVAPNYYDLRPGSGPAHIEQKTWSITGPKTNFLGGRESYGRVNIYTERGTGKTFWTVTWYK